jgi:hypothetical protein
VNDVGVDRVAVQDDVAHGILRGIRDGRDRRAHREGLPQAVRRLVALSVMSPLSTCSCWMSSILIGKILTLDIKVKIAMLAWK